MRWVTVSEIRNAVRSLVRSPTVSVCAVLCLALGIGATTAIFSAVSRALLQPLPFREPERLVAIHRITPQSGPLGGWSQSAANYTDLARDSKHIEGLAAISWSSALINLPSDAIQANALVATGNLFSTLGVPAQVGRLFAPDDDRLDAPAVAVFSDEFWRSRFGADPRVVNGNLMINGVPTTVIGILPRGFRVPLGRNMFSTDVWMPIRFTPERLANRDRHYLQTLGRLAPGASPQSAEADLKRVFAGIVERNPQRKGDDVRVAPLDGENAQSVRRPLLLLMGAVCMVLLIAATNVAALLLARGVQRQRELAVRTALGASRTDVMRPVLIESALVAGASVVLGIGLALAGTKTIGLLAAARLPRLDGLQIDARVLAFALAVSAIVALVAAAAPALRAMRVNPQDALSGGRGGGTGREHHRALRGLVVMEIALSLVLLIGAGLVLKGFARLLGYDPGFDASRVLVLRVATAANRYPQQTGVQRFLEPAIAAIESAPGIEAAAAISSVPYQSWGNNSGIRYEGRPGDEPTRLPIVEQRQVTPGFFDVTKQRLIAGRLLLASDDERPQTASVVVVNAALVKRDFEGKDPVGQRYHLTDSTFATIVGVVSDVRNMGPISEPQPEMYATYRQGALGTSVFPLMIRVRAGDPAAVVQAVRAAIRGIDPSAAVGGVITMEGLIARSLGSPRFYFSMMGTFAAIAVALAVAGLYGILSYAVAQRTREIGIRAALGSPRTAIVRLVAADGFRLVALGVVLGLAGGAIVTRLMESMLYGVSPLDGATWAFAAGLMVLAAMAASLIPASRAARVDPLVAIQAD